MHQLENMICEMKAMKPITKHMNKLRKINIVVLMKHDIDFMLPKKNVEPIVFEKQKPKTKPKDFEHNVEPMFDDMEKLSFDMRNENEMEIVMHQLQNLNGQILH